MFRRIRDFIYDINDIFIALMIILVAVGIIVWRSTMIMSYPEYLANKPDKTVTLDDPAVSGNVSVVIPGGSQNEADNSAENSGEGTAEENSGEEPAGQGGQSTEEGTQKPLVSITLIVNRGDTWNVIVDRLIAADLVEEGDRRTFIGGVEKLGLSEKGKPGQYNLSNEMSYEEMIKTICHVQ